MTLLPNYSTALLMGNENAFAMDTWIMEKLSFTGKKDQSASTVVWAVLSYKNMKKAYELKLRRTLHLVYGTLMSLENC
jgi:hypothetical protein